MTKYIKGKDGKFAGSIGDGKATTPTAAPEGVPTSEGFHYIGPGDKSDPFEGMVRSTTRPVIKEVVDPKTYPVTQTMYEQIGSATIASVSGGRVAATSPITVVLPVDKEITVEVEYDEGMDTYTVRRLQPIMTGRVTMEHKDDAIPPGFIILGEQEDVHFPELSERVYWAGMYHNGSFPDEV